MTTRQPLFRSNRLAVIGAALFGVASFGVQLPALIHFWESMLEEIDHQMSLHAKHACIQFESGLAPLLPTLNSVSVSGEAVLVRLIEVLGPPGDHHLQDATWPASANAAFKEGGSFKTRRVAGHWYRVLGYRRGEWSLRTAAELAEPVAEISVATGKSIVASIVSALLALGLFHRLFHLANDRHLKVLRAAESESSQFHSEAMHELRTPLAILQGQLQAVAQSTQPLEQSETERLMIQVKRLKDTLEALRLLELARISDGQPPLSSLDLVPLLEDLVEDMRAEREDLLIRFDLPKHPQLVNANLGWLRIALGNLCSNAIRHNLTHHGFVEVRLNSSDKFTEIQVTNSGPMISFAEAGQVFSPFYRGIATRQNGIAGQGLGLPLARALLTAMGGSLTLVRSDENLTSFSAMLPPAPEK